MSSSSYISFVLKVSVEISYETTGRCITLRDPGVCTFIDVLCSVRYLMNVDTTESIEENMNTL